MHRGKTLTLNGVAICVITVMFTTAAIAEDFSAKQLDFFERRIRPLLVANCLECHGPEDAESGLRLDHRADMLLGGDRGPAVVAGNANSSLLLRAVSYEDEDLAMPPDGKLKSEQIADLRRWIAEGAAWPAESSGKVARDSRPDPTEHWAFQPVRRPMLPAVGDDSWPRNPIDHFVLARLEEAGLAPSPRARNETLVRRAVLDLWGLPPTYDDVLGFCETGRERSFNQLVQRLLSSRHYGERWGRHWLDVARYADTKGYVDGGQAGFAFAYTYRDYVIRALNEDLPFDQFVFDQLAADAAGYNAAAQWRMAALGFLTVGRRFNHNFHDTLDDEIDVISRGLQGLTVSCARCHDHKFDPIPTTDYYSLHGILANSEEPQHADLPVLESYRQHDTQEHVAELQKRATAYDQEYSKLHRKIQHELRAFAGDYLVYLVRESPQHRDGTQNPLHTKRTILRGPSAYGYGAICRWRNYLSQRAADDPVFGIWKTMDTVEPGEFAAELARLVDDKKFNTQVRDHLRASAPSSMVELARSYGELLEASYADWQQQLESDPVASSSSVGAADEIWQVLFGPDAPATMTRFESIDCYHLDEHTKMRNLAGKVEELSLESKEAAPRAMILRDRAVPYVPVVFRRGQPNRPGDRVPSRIPAVFSAVDMDRGFRDVGDADRVTLARAIISPSNPLTARVIVNRVWHWHFGQPLVTTVSDFGMRSAPPSHPKLLDFLAHWFMETGWSLKKLHHLIMTSSTYQQASLPRADCVSVDPENRLMWRFQPRRLEWEAIRDSLLAVSGRLENTGAGRPVELAPDDPNSVCRTIYLRIDRQHLPQFGRYFDFPAPDFTSPQRPITTVPQQQLFFMNSPFVRKQAETIARAVTQSESDDVGRFRAAYRRVFARETTISDAEILRTLQSLRAGFAVKDAENDSEEKLWSVVSHGMLQSNEFVLLE